jgi:alpha-galactosidase
MPINIDGTRFTLRGDDSAYAFYVGENGDLLHSHFGGPLSDYPSSAPFIPDGGWLQGPSHAYGRAQREFPDNGNGDFGLPAIRIRHGAGTTVTRFLYDSHKVVQGKGGIKGLPATYGDESSASTLLITLKDDVANLTAVLSYAVFPAHNAFARSFQIQNKGSKNVKVQAAASFSIDMGHALEGRKMLQLSGEWAREAQIVERTIQPGFQG